MDFLNENFIPTTQVQIIPNANLFHFGILESSIHMIWTKNFCGRLKSDFRYSKDIVYNNFIWCEPSEKNIKKISATAQNILIAEKIIRTVHLPTCTTLFNAERFTRRTQER